MSRLSDRLKGLADDATKASAKMAEAAAVAEAYGRTEAENQATVDDAIAHLTTSESVAVVLDERFVAALAALPSEARARVLSSLYAAVHATRSLASRIGWSALKSRVKTASAKVDAARAGAQNAEGVAAGVVVDPSDPLEMAKGLATHYEIESVGSIRRWKNRWYRWLDGAYHELDDEILHGLAYNYLAGLQTATDHGPAPLIPNKKLVEYVLHALAPLVQVEGATPTRWLDADSRERPPIERCVFCSNGTLNVDAFLAGRPDAFIAPTPALFVLRTLAMPFHPTAEAARFEQFVAEVFEGDVDRIMALRLLFGYWLLADTSLQVVVIFSGMPQTGKGTLLTIIQAILGVSCCNPSFEQLGGPFGLEDLVGANLAILSDVHDVGPNAKGAVEKLLKISGEDSVDVPRKHKPALNGVRLLARFILAMNELVSLPDISGALARRIVILGFNHSFVGKGQAGLAKSIIAEEGAGVLRWALEGLRLLQHVMQQAAAEGKPTQGSVLSLLRTKGSEDAHEMLSDLGNPVRVFVRERCCLGPDLSIDLDSLFALWDIWRQNNGHQSRSKTRFTADLVAASKGAISTGQRLDATGARPRIVKGIDTLNSGAQLKRDAAAAKAAASTSASCPLAPATAGESVSQP